MAVVPWSGPLRQIATLGVRAPKSHSDATGMSDGLASSRRASPFRARLAPMATGRLGDQALVRLRAERQARPPSLPIERLDLLLDPTSEGLHIWMIAPPFRVDEAVDAF